MIQIVIGIVIFITFLMLRLIFLKPMIALSGMLGRKTGISVENHLLKNFESFSRIIFVILGLYVSINVLKLPPDVKLLINRIIRSCIAFLIFWVLYRMSGFLAQYFLKFSKKPDGSYDNSLMLFFNNSLKLIICIFGVTVILQQWGYDFAALITGLGIGGLAFALAAKDTIANLFGSVMIMLDKPFSVGDHIITSKAEGKVESIGFRSTRIRTADQAVVTIPNSIISNEPITNVSQMELKRVNFRLSLPSSIDSKKLNEFLKSLRAILESYAEIFQDSSYVFLDRFNGLNLEIVINYFLISTSEQQVLKVQEDFNVKIKALMETFEI